jgi:hypothetical protein
MMKCEIMSATITKSPKQVHLTVHFFPTDSEIPSVVYYKNIELKLHSYTKDPDGSIRASYSSSIKEKRFVVGRIYKSIPESVYNALMSTCQIQRLLPISDLNDTVVRIKLTSDEYGADGFTLSEILLDLGINIDLPPIHDYHIAEFAIRKGTSVEAAIRTLVPLPFVINYVEEDVWEINPNSLSTNFFGFASDTPSVTSVVETFKYYTVGGLGEPRYVSSPTTNCNMSTDDVDIVFNRFGSVYGVTRESYVVTSSSYPAED